LNTPGNSFLQKKGDSVEDYHSNKEAVRDYYAEMLKQGEEVAAGIK